MSITNFGPYTLRSLRSKNSKVADNGFTATLCRHGHAVGTIDCGHSPDDDDLVLEFVSNSEMAFFQNTVQTLVTGDDLVDEHGEVMERDERFLRDLAEHTYHQERLAALCKHSTVFRLPADPPGRWRQVRAPFRPALVGALRQMFPSQALQFANQP